MSYLTASRPQPILRKQVISFEHHHRGEFMCFSTFIEKPCDLVLASVLSPLAFCVVGEIEKKEVGVK